MINQITCNTWLQVIFCLYSFTVFFSDLLCLSFGLLVNNNRAVVVCVGGVAPILEELVADTVAVLNEYVSAPAAVTGELAVLDEVAVADVEYTDCAAYVVSLVAFKGAVADQLLYSCSLKCCVF